MNADYGAGVWVILGIYFLGLFAVGVYAFRANKAATQQGGSGILQHYLAGKDLGTVVLSMSVLASLYSGYAMVGLPGEGYDRGYYAVRWASSGLGIAIGFTVINPLFLRAARMYHYVSCLDFVTDRYGDQKALNITILVSLLLPLFFYMVAQFTAFGSTLHAFSGGTIPTYVSAITLAVILLVYEAFGGLRAVAFTDVIQGFVLLMGSLLFYVFVGTIFGGLPAIGDGLLQKQPLRLAVPEISPQLEWLLFYIQGFAYPLYPHMMVRTFAAKDYQSLQRSILLVCVSPFLVLLPAAFIGIAVITRFDGAEASEVFGLLMGQVLNYNTACYLFGSVILAAAVAAIMSTCDSILIALSHLICLDIVRPHVKSLAITPFQTEAQRSAVEHKLLLIGRVVSIVVAIAAVALGEIGLNLSFLLILQNAILLQALPTFLGGMLFLWLRWESCFAGMTVGLLTLFILAGLSAAPLGVPPGLWASFANLVALGITQLVVDHMQPTRPMSVAPESPMSSPLDKPRTIRAKLPSVGLNAVQKGMLVFSWLLGLFTIPFYRTPGTIDRLVGGVPVWAVISLVLGAVGTVVLVVLWIVWPAAMPRQAPASPGNSGFPEEDWITPLMDVQSVEMRDSVGPYRIGDQDDTL